MILHGPGGTGKSHVISAVRHFAALWDLSSKILVTASTGVAAILIAGQTYHSALGLGRKRKRGPTKASVSEYFEKLQLLIIDEMSMIGQSADRRIDHKLRDLTERRVPYGGITVVYCGDFCQLPPVRESPLFGGNPLLHQQYIENFPLAICLTRNHRICAPREAAIMDEF